MPPLVLAQSYARTEEGDHILVTSLENRWDILIREQETLPSLQKNRMKIRARQGRFVRRENGRMCSHSRRNWDRQSSGCRGVGEGAGGAEGRRGRAAGSRLDGSAIPSCGCCYFAPARVSTRERSGAGVGDEAETGAASESTGEAQPPEPFRRIRAVSGGDAAGVARWVGGWRRRRLGTGLVSREGRDY
jgi:hypothetical protein